MHLHNYLKQMNFQPPLLTFSSTVVNASSLREHFAYWEASTCTHTHIRRGKANLLGKQSLQVEGEG